MKTKTLTDPVSLEIAAFAVVVETKLQREGYDLAESWKGIPVQTLVRQLESKIKGLQSIDVNTSPNEFFAKVVVIGSLTMMLAELSSRKQKNPFDLKNGKMDIILTAPKMCSTGPSRAGQE